MRFLQRRSLLRFLQRGAVRAILQRRVLSARVLNPRGLLRRGGYSAHPGSLLQVSATTASPHRISTVAPESSSLQYLPTFIAAIPDPVPMY